MTESAPLLSATIQAQPLPPAFESEVLKRGASTIVNQVAAMKRMVDDFRDYARVPPAHLLEWKKLIDAYLQERETLKLSCLILDARRGWMEKDLDLKRWLEHHGRPYLVVATKTDKLNQSELEHGMRAIRKEGVEGLPFSALNGRGVREIWQAITKTHPPL